jgi:hypothetical protein
VRDQVSHPYKTTGNITILYADASRLKKIRPYAKWVLCRPQPKCRLHRARI